MQKVNLKYVVFISLVSALGGFLFGYDWVVIGGAKPFYEAYFGIGADAARQGWLMSSALVGCLAGALVAGYFSDRFGRRKIFLLSAVVFIVSTAGTGMSGTPSSFVLWRILGGVAIGIVSNLSPMYIAEVAPAAIRGRLVSFNQLTIVLGVLAAQIANWQIAEPVPAGSTQEIIAASWNGMHGWRWMFWANGIPAALFLGLLFAIPESPRWLAVRGYESRARKILEKIGGENYAAVAVANDGGAKPSGGLQKLFSPSMRRVLTIGVVLAVFQQWCGINVIFNYAQEIFSAAGYDISQMLLNIVITGVTNLVFTCVAIFTVDRLGRRTLLLAGSAGLAVSFIALGICYLFGVTGTPMMVLVVAALACYAVSLAPVMWVVISEIFPNAVRGAAMGVATFALWAACFVLTYTFPLLNGALGAAGTFLIYGVICVAGWLFVQRFVPETKNRTLEEIEEQLVK